MTDATRYDLIDDRHGACIDEVQGGRYVLATAYDAVVQARQLDLTTIKALEADVRTWVDKAQQVAAERDAATQRITELEAALGQRGIRDVAFTLSDEAQQKMEGLEAELAQAEGQEAALKAVIEHMVKFSAGLADCCEGKAKPAEEERVP